MRNQLSIYVAPCYSEEEVPGCPYPRHVITSWRYELILNGKIQYVEGDFATIKTAQDAGRQKASELGTP